MEGTVGGGFWVTGFFAMKRVESWGAWNDDVYAGLSDIIYAGNLDNIHKQYLRAEPFSHILKYFGIVA